MKDSRSWADEVTLARLHARGLLVEQVSGALLLCSAAVVLLVFFSNSEDSKSTIRIVMRYFEVSEIGASYWTLGVFLGSIIVGSMLVSQRKRSLVCVVYLWIARVLRRYSEVLVLSAAAAISASAWTLATTLSYAGQGWVRQLELITYAPSGLIVGLGSALSALCAILSVRCFVRR